MMQTIICLKLVTNPLISQEFINKPNWFAIYTKPRTEKKVLERLVEKGYDAYLPLHTSIRQWSDRKKKISTPLIPGYVFVCIDKERLFDILKIDGTVGVLRYLGKPAIVRDYEIENLKILMNDIESVDSIGTLAFMKGEEVEVSSGLFKGLRGKSVSIQGKHRLIVEVEALGSRIVVNVPVGLVKKINDKIIELPILVE